MNINSVIDWIVPSKIRQSSLDYSRAKGIVGCGIIAILVIPLFALVHKYLHDPVGSLAILTLGGLILFALFILKISGSLFFSREIIIASTFALLIGLSYSQGGIQTPPLFWLILIPTLATFLGGIKNGIIWGIIVELSVLLLYVLQVLNFPLPITPITNMLLLHTASLWGLMAVVLTLVYFFEIGKIQGFRKLEEAIKNSEQLTYKLNAILTAAADGIITANDRNEILSCNRAVNEIFNYHNHDLVGKNLNLIIDNSHLNNSTESLCKFEGTSKNGVKIPLEVSTSKILLDEENINIYIIRDIRERKRAEDRLAYLAHYDQLTGLPNRMLYEILLNNAISRARRTRSLVVILYLDLDHFKNINDTLGHDTGDLFLKEVVNRFKQSVRESDVITRLGGDEFAIILEDVHAVEYATRIAENIIDSLKQPIVVKDYQVFTGTSIGISIFPNNGIDSVTLTKNADIAMYHAKEKGRNNFQYYDEALNNHIISQISLENQLRNALKSDELFILYQPQIDLQTNEIVGIEALLRWNNPTLGLVDPASFIPVAEKTGLITEIGSWVLTHAAEQFKLWQMTGFIKPTTKLALNISIVQVLQENFIPQVKKIFEFVGINPNCIELELTETLIMHDPARSQFVLKELRSLGIQMAIDDYGIGYSSLSRLKDFPVKTLKIDKSFILDWSKSNENASIIKSIIALAHGLDLKVAAEGVETIEQLKFLQQNHCDYAQGYFLSPPLYADAMTTYLQNYSAKSKALI